MPLEGNFIPASYTCIPLHQLSACSAPHTLLPAGACSAWAHTALSSRRGGGVSHHQLQSFFIGVKVSDSLHVLQTDDYIWSQITENSEAVSFVSTLAH